ncbi:MAG: YdcF family protein [Bacteroidetes bacterium]|nr:YdcF family protein [Bacteroidota bacterium]
MKKENFYIPLFILAACWFFLSTNYLIPKLLISQLENKYSPYTSKISKDTSVYNIVVLGAGFTENKKLPFNDQLSPSALSRLIEGIRIYNLHPKSKLIVSGPGFEGEISQGEVFKKVAVSLGIDSSSINIINTATNTYEEAKKYTEKFGKDSQVILVTSSYHMPRAMTMFEHNGIKPVPAPTDFKFKNNKFSPMLFFPSIENMHYVQIAIIEYTGLVYAKWFLF